MPTAKSPASKEVVTAALLVIGGKILSGRTKDQNIGYVAEYLTAVGVSGQERTTRIHSRTRQDQTGQASTGDWSRDRRVSVSRKSQFLG
jgi:hypothetical protein